MFSFILIRSEKKIATTDKVEYDGVGFSLQDKKVTALLFESSGGIDFNTTPQKEKHDEIKMITNIISVLKDYEVSQKDVKHPIVQHYIRCFGKSCSIRAVVVFFNRMF